ncbi:MAG TPA: histidinol-phosphate transaminase [Candidatus Paceibacterota bacterium]|jgi:histidinol-phosphate/aromatic aminotransferase/cobyric acid decarboxylase-like protein|nr:histidinol-phosphate transaminase [Candidatus Paceibacterota bacterium]
MAIHLNKKEQHIRQKLRVIKEKSGSHSPSPAMLARLEGCEVKHDFCYINNPHATDLFFQFFRKDFKNTENLRRAIERYPSQGQTLSERLSPVLKIPPEQLFIGNGATEIIQAVLQNFVKRKILIPVPTFSSYIDFASKGVQVAYHKLKKDFNFQLNVPDFLADVKKEKPDAVVIINPNNPDGGYLAKDSLKKLLSGLASVPTVILDESFVHFADKNKEVTYGSIELFKKFPNVIIIKSLSKDFGIAGLRLGYAVMSENRVSALFRRGYLWNVSGFGEYFLGLLENKKFQQKYEKARLRAMVERDICFEGLSKIKDLKVYPSKGNFFLAELTDGSKADDLVVALLVRYGIYIRSCKDKTGLQGEFVRIASRKKSENDLLKKALGSIF